MQRYYTSRRWFRLPAIPGAVLSLGLLSAAAAAETPPPAGFDETVENALNLGGGRYGKVNFDLRWRYEYVDQDTAKTPGPAEASTARLRLGYLTPEFLGFKAFAEYEGNQDIGVNDYNSGRNKKTQYPVIADPQINEVNQLWASYGGLPDTLIKVGRQRLIFDNHRFVGNVVWRQMEQTFDAATVTTSLIPRTTATAGYLFGVQDILSKYARMNSPVLNVNFDTGYGNLIGYGYWLDYEDKGAEGGKDVLLGKPSFAKSNKSFGLRFDSGKGTPVMEGLKALYTLEYAHQENYGNNPKTYETDYWLAEGGVDIMGLTLKAAWEQLGADNGVGFQTPLSTLHAFQGWADLFLATPPDGIRDMYGTIKYTLYGIDLMAVYHEFSDQHSRQDYGHEVDLLAEKKFGKHYSVLFKFADFVADKGPDGQNALGKPDTQKFWIQASVSY
jgi:hypothetical protein